MQGITRIGACQNQICVAYCDNAAVNSKLFRMLHQTFPFLIHVPCAAHCIQLIVNSCLSSSTFSSTNTSAMKFIYQFRNQCELRHQFNSMSPLCIPAPCDARWNSKLLAFERLIKVKKDINYVAEQSDVFWSDLEKVIAFLKPFQLATDIVQADSSTLYHVYLQFIGLLQHTQQQQLTWAQQNIVQRWNKHVNIEATVACALLSFESIDPHFQQYSSKSRQFIIEFGAAYLNYWNISIVSVAEL